MKKSVQISTYSIIMTIIAFGLLIGCGIFALNREQEVVAYLDLGITIALCLAALFYSPLSISLSDESLNINRSLHIKSLPLSEIASVKLCPPTMGAKRICGSGGWFGYWGWFSERDLGKYFAYYGKSSDCFLVTLKDGRKYMLGCKDAPEMVAAIQAKLK